MIRFITFCVISFAATLISVYDASEVNNCDHVKCPPIPKHYEEFNCVAMKANDTKSCCPTQ